MSSNTILAEFRTLSPDEQKELRQQLLDPDQKTSNTIWRIVIWAFAIALVLAVIALLASIWALPVTGGTKPETILTVFTTASAFLAGLFAPSPVADK